MISRLLIVGSLVLAICGSSRAQARRLDNYDVLLHSTSVEEQRTALTAVLRNPQVYIPRIRQNLQNYSGLLRTDKAAANRAVYVGALVRDPSFAPILVRLLGDPNVLSECEYPCPVVSP
jgi:hypothetical protein